MIFYCFKKERIFIVIIIIINPLIYIWIFTIAKTKAKYGQLFAKAHIL